MKTYQTLFIGVTALCLFAVLAASADAAVPKKAVVKLATKAKDYISQIGNSIGSTIWANKGSIAVGTTAVAVVRAPAPFAEAATTIITGRPAPSSASATGNNSSTVGWFWYYPFYAMVTLLCIIGVRYAWGYIKDYKNWLPVLIVGLCFVSCGVAEAGVFQSIPMTEGIVSFIPRPPTLPPVPVPVSWWTIINTVLVIITICF